jgi:CRP-like cAMP-binding protein
MVTGHGDAHHTLMVTQLMKWSVGVEDLNPLKQRSGHPDADSIYRADEELVRALAAAGEMRKVESGDRLFSFGDAARGVYLILKGTARTSLAGEEREVMCRTAGPGSVLGLPAALCGNHYHLDVQALEAVEAVFLETATVNELLRGQPELCMRAMRMMCDEMEALRQTRENMQSCGKESCALHEQCTQAVRPQ